MKKYVHGQMSSFFLADSPREKVLPVTSSKALPDGGKKNSSCSLPRRERWLRDVSYLINQVGLRTACAVSRAVSRAHPEATARARAGPSERPDTAPPAGCSQLSTTSRTMPCSAAIPHNHLAHSHNACTAQPRSLPHFPLRLSLPLCPTPVSHPRKPPP